MGDHYRDLKSLVERLDLHTVCESAACPNVGECWNHRTATFMILGNVCTRRCGFCAVAKGAPLAVDYDEPRRVAEAVAALGLELRRHHQRQSRRPQGRRRRAVRAGHPRHSRARAGLPRRGADPRFPGLATRPWTWCWTPRPDVLNHNTETVPRLYRQVRLGARYERSLDMLAYAKRARPDIPTKSGLMLGLGETAEEVLQVMRDLRAHDVDILTLGQYLRPSPKHLPVVRYVTPEEFDRVAAGRAARWASATSSRGRWCAVPTTPPSGMAFRPCATSSDTRRTP